MKMVKKILLGLAAGALVLGVAGCKPEVAGNEDLIKISGNSGSIDYTNDGDAVTRGFRTLKTKHLDAICHIEYTVTDLVKGKDAVATGTMGYIFNVVKDDDDKYSFTIAGARYNQDKGNIQAYVETFKGVAKDKLEQELTGGIHATGTKDDYTSTAYGFELVDKDTVKEILDAQGDNKKLELWIDLVANGQVKKTVDGVSTMVTPKGRDGAVGTYTVNFYGSDPLRNSAATSYDLTWNNASADLLYTCTVKAADVNAAYDESKGLSSMQSDVGFYANVYKGQTLKGKWQFSEIKKEAEEIEE